MVEGQAPGIGNASTARDPLAVVKALAGALASQSFVAALATAAAYSAVQLPARRFLLPFVLLTWCGTILGLGVYLASLERARPRIFALRMGLTFFVYSEACAVAVVFGLVSLGIETEQEALTATLPFWVNVAAFGSLGLYLMFRRRAKQMEAGGARRPDDRG